MVFETQRDNIVAKIQSKDYLNAKTDLESLILLIEAHYATLPAGQKAQWENTRLEISHANDHLAELVKRDDPSQSNACITILTGVQRI
jgi:hypothetical protein